MPEAGRVVKTSPEAPARRAASRERRRDATPAGPQVMQLAAARWVLDVVLVHQGGWPLTSCSCFYGTCGGCDHGRHDRCLNLQRPSAWYGTSETWITRKGRIVGPPVWLAGRPCRYRCPCTCPAAEPTRPPAADLPSSDQLELFALEVA